MTELENKLKAHEISPAIEKALNRGAKAGWALGMALKEVCPERSEIAIKAAAAALALLLTGPAEAHCFSIWHYPYPQKCGLTARYHAPESKNWYVEVVHPASSPSAAVAPSPPAPVITDPAPPPSRELDLRTPEQIQESKEHAAMVRKYHDEINALMHLLHGESEQ